MTRKNSPWERALAVASFGTPACADSEAASALMFAEPPDTAQDPEIESLGHRVTRLERLVAQGSQLEPAGPARRSDAA